MVVRVNNLSKWECLKPGVGLELPEGQRRQIRIEVNCVAPTRFDVVEGRSPTDPDAKHTFLAVVQGLEVLDFRAGGRGPVHVVPQSDDEVWYFTNDGGVGSQKQANPVSFVQIATRATRNPELELMMFKAQQNELRRDAKLADEIRKMREAVAANADVRTGEVSEPADAAADAGAAGGAESEFAPAPAPAAK